MFKLLEFENANQAFENLYRIVNKRGAQREDNIFIPNVGFYISNPIQNEITNPIRKWKLSYAQLEWRWYLTANKSAKGIAKHAKIWYKCMDENGDVNSNYGWHWKQGDQISYVIDELTRDPNSRRASLSIYDAKDRYNWENDPPCTYAINFWIDANRLHMNVMMRSNDLWYGFCNDQFCFSMLMIDIARELNISVGKYFHFTNNLHIYNNFKNRLI